MIRTHHKEVQEIFKKVIPVRAEHLYMEDVILYDCLSEEFDEVPEGEVTPEYVVSIKNNMCDCNARTVEAAFRRIK